MTLDRAVSKIEDRASSLGRPPRTLPSEVSDWFEANRGNFGGGEVEGGGPIPEAIMRWVRMAVEWIVFRPMSEMPDWELNVVLAAEPGTWPDSALERWLGSS